MGTYLVFTENAFGNYSGSLQGVKIVSKVRRAAFILEKIHDPQGHSSLIRNNYVPAYNTKFSFEKTERKALGSAYYGFSYLFPFRELKKQQKIT